MSEVISRSFALVAAVLLCMLVPAAQTQAQGVEAPTSGPSPQTAAESVRPPVSRGGGMAPRIKIVPAGHGWVIQWDEQQKVSLVLHLPPRVQPPLESSRVEVAGTVRSAPGLGVKAVAMASYQGRVYAALEETLAPTSIGAADSPQRQPQIPLATSPSGDTSISSGWQRRIVGLSAVAGEPAWGANGVPNWSYAPGRWEIVATLPGKLELLAMGACRSGPVVLIRPIQRQLHAGPADPELWMHIGGLWRAVEGGVPWRANGSAGSASASVAADPNRKFWLLSPRDRLAVAELLGDSLRVWEANLDSAMERIPEGPRPLALAWSSRDFQLGDFPTPDHVLSVDGQLVVTRWIPGTGQSTGSLRLAMLRAVESGGLLELPMISGVPCEHEITGMDGGGQSVGRVAVVWRSADPGSGSGSDVSSPRAAQAVRRFHVAEVGVTGREPGRLLFSGPVRSELWLSAKEYQTLVALMVLVTAAVVVFVLRSEPTKSPVLPKGAMLAEPSRRLVAAVLDYLPAALLVQLLFQIPVPTLFSISGVFSEHFSLWAVLGALAAAAAHCTICEWLFGRSLGKLLTGCVVAGVRTGTFIGAESGKEVTPAREGLLGKPRLWQCVVRNLVKWLLPVLGVLSFMDPGHRHPGDLLSRTLVLLNRVVE